jgi:hypothetical protein
MVNQDIDTPKAPNSDSLLSLPEFETRIEFRSFFPKLDDGNIYRVIPQDFGKHISTIHMKTRVYQGYL